MIANAHDLVPNPWRICTCPPVTHGPWGKRSAMWNKLLCGTRCSFEVPGASWNRNMPCTHSLARIVSLGWFWMVLAHVFLGLTIPCKGITLLKVASSACGHMSVFVYSVVPTPPFQQTCQCPTNQMIYCELQGGKLEWHCSFAYVNSQESRIFVSGGRFFHVFSSSEVYFTSLFGLETGAVDAKPCDCWPVCEVGKILDVLILHQTWIRRFSLKSAKSFLHRFVFEYVFSLLHWSSSFEEKRGRHVHWNFA